MRDRLHSIGKVGRLQYRPPLALAVPPAPRDLFEMRIICKNRLRYSRERAPTRSKKIQTEYLFANIGFYTRESEASKVCYKGFTCYNYNDLIPLLKPSFGFLRFSLCSATSGRSYSVAANLHFTSHLASGWRLPTSRRGKARPQVDPWHQ